MTFETLVNFLPKNHKKPTQVEVQADQPKVEPNDRREAMNRFARLSARRGAI